MNEAAAALLLGLLGGAHCFGMCGGIMGALVLALPPSRRKPKEVLPLLLSYNLGRLISYTLAGLLLGLVGHALSQQPMLLVALRTLAGALLIAMGLYLGGWWQGLTKLEQLGTVLWRHLQPIAQRMLPVRSNSQALLLGTLWGWLPCGLVYSALLWTSSQGDPLKSAGLMLLFGLGTLPALLITGLAADHLRRWVQSQVTRQLAGVLVLLFGLWSLPGPHQSWLMQQLHSSPTTTQAHPSAQHRALQPIE